MKLISLLITLLAISPLSLKASESIKLTGRALYSFSQEYALIATDHHIYKISVSGISNKNLRQVNRSSVQNKIISIEVPKSSIEFMWPSQQKISWDDARIFKAASTELIANAKINSGEFALNGKTTYSFSEPFFLIQANDEIFRITKSKLSKEQHDLISKTGLGSQLSVAIPKSSVQLAWTILQPNSNAKARASAPILEHYSRDNNMITVTGIVLLSFDDPLVLIHSKDMIFQFMKENIQTNAPMQLNIPGSMVKIKAHISSLKFAWPSKVSEPNPTISNRIKIN